MRDGEPFQFGVFFSAAPTFLNAWRQGPRQARWDRHYLLQPGTSLRIIGGERVELTGAETVDGFRIEKTLLNAAFPLDWMSVTLLERHVGAHLHKSDLDGRSAQTFVNTLAVPGLVQASVLKRTRTAFHGAIIASTTELSVPDWGASCAWVSFESANPDALRALLKATGLGNRQHQDLDDWLRQAYRNRRPVAAARPAATAERRQRAA
ncbi:hypothetical protein [Acuticoccus kandeliae]|uniref:hypothetical protein n=1 Tax=Acuticoccus kandeliae TaxID=2073160 RepID=UPI000D3E985E|nr:hypothetical protein [Acuticoccus kandeliae]